jgi:hypothetical protein
MKKLLFTLLCLVFGQSLFAQEAATKKVQAGLIVGSGLNFQESKTDYFSPNEAGTDLSVGMNFNFNFTETIGFCTGLEFDFSNTRFKTNDTIFYRFTDKEIIRKRDYDASKNYGMFQLASRIDKSIYLSIPTMLLFRTKFIGYFRYFGKFGLRNSFLLKTESFDKGYEYKSGSSDDILVDKANMTTKSNMLFYKGAIGIAGGAEWNFSGSTSLVGELGYYYGITPLYWERSADSDKLSLFQSGINNGTGNDTYSPIKARQSQLMMKVSILF